MMKKMGKRLFLVLLLFLSLQVFPAQKVQAGSTIQTVDVKGSFEEFAHAIGELIKKYNIDLGDLSDVANQFFSKRLIVKAKSEDVSFDQLHPLAVVKGPLNLYALQFSTEEEAKNALKQLVKSSLISYAESDGAFAANDVSGSLLSASGTHKSWGADRMNVDSYAGYVAGKTKDSITVAVVDSGVASHPFLQGRIAAGYDFVGMDTAPDDLCGHGTHVAGTIVDCTPGLNVQIMPVRVLNAFGFGYNSVVASGIRYAADHGAKVINLSLGGMQSEILDEMITYAVKKGVTVVVAAGNDGSSTSNTCPAHLKDAIVVGAVDSGNHKASFSNTGSTLDVVAPGVGIVSCVPGGGYESMDGTSMASPHVAAVAAMYRLLYPDKTPAQIEQMIKANTQDLGNSGWDSSYGSGIPKLKAAAAQEKVTLNKTSATIRVGKTVKLKAKVTPSGKVSWSSSDTSIATVSNGTVKGKNPGKVQITATTAGGATATCKVTVKKKTVKPTGITLNTTLATITMGEKLTLKATVTPDDATNRSVSWSSSDTDVASVSKGIVTGKNSGIAVITAKTSNGYKARCTVTVKSAPTRIVLDKEYYQCEQGEEVILHGKITMPENVTLNQKKYKLYIASMGRGWTEEGSYQIGGSKNLLEPEKSGSTRIVSCTGSGKKLDVQIGIGTGDMESSLIPRMMKVAVYPSDQGMKGKSLHEVIFFLTVR